MGGLCQRQCVDRSSCHPRRGVDAIDHVSTMYLHSCAHPSFTAAHIEASIAAQCEEHMMFLMYCDLIDKRQNDRLVLWMTTEVIPDINISHSARESAMQGDFEPARDQVLQLMKFNRIIA